MFTDSLCTKKELVLLMVSAIKEEQIPELILQGKDREVMPLLYKKVLPLVKRYVTSNSGNNDDAHDIFHDSLMLFYEQVMKGEFDPKYKAFGYIYKVGVFRWINKCKKDKNIQLAEELPDTEVESSNYMDFQIMSGEEKGLLQQLFSSIGEKCIELLNYTIYTDMFMEDITARMGMASVDATRMQQMRCKQKLMKEIEKNPQLINRIKGL